MVNLDEYDPDVVDKAFWLQQKIYEDGLYPVGFMRVAHQKASNRSAQTVAKNIRRRLK
jgi:hypothetical protein